MKSRNKYDRIFILGSGFSKAFSSSMPSVADLTAKLYDNSVQKGNELQGFLDTLTEIPTVEASKTIEDITTIIFSKKVFNNVSEEDRYSKLRNQLLLFIYKEIAEYSVDEEAKSVLIKFLEACCCGNDPNEGTNWGKNLLVTFNYDLLIEEMFAEHVGDYKIDYGIKFNQYTNFNIEPSSGGRFLTEYIKLHGSFNWFKAKGASDNNITSIYTVDKHNPNWFIHEDDIPEYIPMAHSKELFLHGTLYNTLWVKANYYFNNAKEIYFIGYGFPDTDFNNLYYFYQYKEKIKAVIVYYNNNDKKQHEEYVRLVNIFGNNIITNIDAKEYIANNVQNFCHYKLK